MKIFWTNIQFNKFKDELIRKLYRLGREEVNQAYEVGKKEGKKEGMAICAATINKDYTLISKKDLKKYEIHQ